jgi:sigma-B regulation protein RsbU (phosphoserine phosphatase)
MPEMDGLTLLDKIRELNRPFRSIVISAYGDMENIRAAMNLGASDFITKPIDLKDLATTLEKITDQYNTLMQGMRAQNRLIEYHKELEIASNIQQTFMPQNISPFPEKVEIFGKMFPAQEIGGDFFDFFRISNNQIGFVIADVSGKGVPAALFMVMSKTLLRSAALANPSPKECMMEVSHYLCYNNESMMFVTGFYGLFNIDTGIIHYVDAGHLPPYIIAADGTLSKLPKEGGIALGIVDDTELASKLLQEKTVQLKKDDCLFLYTDGLTESINKNEELYPTFRLENILKTHAKGNLPTLVSDIKNDITDFTEGCPQFDDITLLCIRWKG